MRNDCNRKCNGLSSVKWRKTFISLRNPCGYIGLFCLMRSVRCVYRNVRFYAFLCISSSGGMLFFVYFPCTHALYGYDKVKLPSVGRLYSLLMISLHRPLIRDKINVWKVEKCDGIVWQTKCKCDGFG